MFKIKLVTLKNIYGKLFHCCVTLDEVCPAVGETADSNMQIKDSSASESAAQIKKDFIIVCGLVLF